MSAYLLPHMKNRAFTHTLQNINPERIFRKTVMPLAFLFLFSVTLYSQVTWDGEAGTSDWGDPLNWSSNSVPLPGDDVAVNTAISITGVPSIILNSLSVTQNVILISDAGSTLTIDNVNGTPALIIAGSTSLTLGGGTALSSVNLVFQTVTGATGITGTLTNTANNSITLNNGQVVSVSGSLINTNNGTILINGTLNNSGTFTANAGTVTVNGSVINTGIINGLPANLSFAPGSTYSHNRNGGSIPLAAWDAASICSVSGLTNTTLAGGLNQTFGNLFLSCAGLSAPLTLSPSGAMSVQGNLLLQGSPVNTLTLAPGANNLTVNGTTTINGNGIFNDANIGGTNTFAGDVNVNGNWNNTTSAVNVGGNLIVNSGAVFNSGAGIYTMSGTGKVIGGTIAGITISSLSVTGSLENNLATLTVPTLNIPGTFTNITGQTLICSTLLAGTGSFIQQANATLTIGNSATITTLTANAAGNTVNYTRTGAQNILPVDYYNLTLSGNNTKTITGVTGVLGALTFNGAGTLAIGTNALTVASVNRLNPIIINLSSGSFIVNSSLLLALTDPITFTGAGILNVSGDLTCGALTAFSSTIQVSGNFGPNSFSATTGTVDLNGALAQQINGGYTFGNLTLSGGSNKILTANTTIANSLNLVSGVLQLGNFNLTFSGTTGTTAITGTPSPTNMIETNGTGLLVFTNASLPNTALNGTYPVGLNGTYNPLVLSGLAGGTGNRTFRIRVASGQLFVNGINRYWEITRNNVPGTPALSFAYNASEALGDITKFQPYTNVSGSWGLAPSPSAQGVNPVTSTTAAALPATSLWTAAMPGAFYSYQTGDWNNPTTWTNDPSGSTLNNPLNAIPGYLDVVYILTSRTVSLTTDIATTGLDLTISAGGFLDLSSWQFQNGLLALRGQGTVRISPSNPVTGYFPAATANTFVNAGGGTTEYNSTTNLPASQLTYNNLSINTAGTVTQKSNIILNGDLFVKQGTFRINDNAAGRYQLTVGGNVTVSNGAFFTVGTGTTNAFTDPVLVPAGGASPFTNYYDGQSHRVVVKGDFTNNGTVKFTNQANPEYTQFPSNGFATVYFQGSSNNTLTCNGQTSFYNLVLDKGTDPTFRLTVYSTAFNNFRLYGANNAAIESGNANPNVRKALWIRNGTLVLTGLTVIPSLSEGLTAAAPTTTDFLVPGNGALILDGAFVTVLSTADDYTEVNAAYGLAGGSNALYGINAGNGGSGLAISGILQVNNGYLSTRESGGLTYWSYGSGGQFIVTGGTVDTKQFHNPQGAATGLISYFQTGGNVIFRGRFQNVINYPTVSSLSSPAINTARADNGIDATAGIGALSINSNAANGFTMSGGTMVIHDVCGTTGTNYAFYAGCPVSNINVTGGTVQINPTSGTVSADADYLINSTAPFGNLTISRVSGASVVQLTANSLTVLGNLNLATASSALTTNNLDVTIGGNFTVENGAAYNPGTNTTTLNGANAQTFTNNLAGLSLNNFTINKAAGVAVNLAGNSINVAGNFNLSLGRLNDNGFSVFVSKNVYNSGLHTGTGKISLNGSVSQTIDGNGVFQNLELNNASGAPGSAPVSLVAHTTVNGTLTLSQDRIFNIGTYNLKLNSNASIVNWGANRYLQSAGNSGDGGITRQYSVSSPGFTFPIGAPTITPALPAAYTPATINITSAPATWGYITVVPVGVEHPATTTKNLNLTYYWRIKSSGFTGLAAGSVTHSYAYNPADVPNPGQVGSYVPARYDESTFTWTSGTSASINTVARVIGVGVGDPFMSNTNNIEGDYTAGLAADFGVPAKFWSRQSGNWNLTTTWSTVSSAGPAAARIPAAGDIVIIGDYPARNDSVWLNNGIAAGNGSAQNCANLLIKRGSALDAYTYSASNFGVVSSFSGGNGKFRVTTAVATNWRFPQIFTFPSGDFSDFNANGGTTEFYDIDGSQGCLYILPPNVTSYGNLMMTAKGGDNIILPNNSLTTIYGNLTCGGDNNRAWICMSWSTGHNGFTIDNYDPIVEKTVHVTGNLYVNTGTLIFMDEYLPQHLVVDGNVTVGTNAWIDVNIAGGNSPGAAPQPNTFVIGGSLTNNSLALLGQPGIRFRSGTYYCDVTFQGSANANISGTSPSTIFNKLTVNKGTSQATTLTCNVGGTLTTPTDNWLTLQNGTFIYNRNGDLTISQGSTFTVPSTAGLSINTPSNTFIANANSNVNTMYLSGTLTLASGNTGNVYIGQPGAPDNCHNDIEYSSGGASAIQVDGGNLYVNGQIRRNPSNAAGILSYSQSTGNVILYGRNCVAPFNNDAKLEVLNTGSQFNMSGGALTIVRGNGGAFGDLYLRPQTGSVTGGTITLAPGAAVGSNQNYKVESSIPLNNLVITGFDGSNKATVQLMVSPLVLNGDLTISNPNSALNAVSASGNSINVTFNGNVVNNGNAASYLFGTNLTTFSATNASPYLGVQSLTGTGTTNFYDLQVNPEASLSINRSIIVNRNLSIGSGTLVCSLYKADVAGNFTNNGNYTDNNGLNMGICLNGTTVQQVGGSGTFGRLELNNPAGARLNSSISLQEDLLMTQGIFDVNSNLLTLGVNSNIGGAPFGATKMIATQGVFSNIGIKKFFSTSPQVFTFPIGTSGKYTPAVLTINASSYVGSIRINNINGMQPAVIDPANALKYYWEVESSGISGFTGNLVLNYLPGDVVGSQENNYLAARLIVPGTSWSITGGVVPASKTITFNYINSLNLCGEYTAGIATAFPPNVPTFTSNADGIWNDNSIWDQTGGTPYVLAPGNGPNGFIVIVNHEVTANSNNCSAYKTTINGKLKIVAPFYGHNLGTVTGNGTLYLENGAFPAGLFTTFLDCNNNATIEYGGTGTYSIIADLYDNVPNLLFSGTGTRILPDKDITVCKSLKIGTLTDGPILDNSVYNRKLIIQGTMERYNTGTFNGGSGTNATVEFAGSASQVIGGATGNFVGTSAFNNFEVNNTLGLTVNGPTEIGGNLVLTNGLINTSSLNSLTIVNTAINCVFPPAGITTSYVNGPLTKKINQGDNFFFPIGQNLIPGNKISLSSTQTGTLLWSAQYFSPNSTFNSYTAPLAAVSWNEYWKVSAPAGNGAIVGLTWDPASDITPLVTMGGKNDMRVAWYNTGTSEWNEIPSNASGNDYNGNVSTTGRITIPALGSSDFTMASVTTLIPKAKLSPTGPVCGISGVPVTFSAPVPVPPNYKLTYTVNGGAPQTVVITPAMMPYKIPTNPVTSQIIKLTGFSYNTDAAGDGGLTGVVDVTTVTAYANPTTADAGIPQSLCGITATNLNGNIPVTGTGVWSIVLPNFGGTVITPTNPTSQFNGLNGKSYTLKWKISNGTCTSSSNTTVNFTLLPDAPTASPAQTLCTGAVVSDIVASTPTGTVNWFANATGGVALPGTTTLVSGNNYYGEVNNGCISETRTQVTVTINNPSAPTGSVTQSFCTIDNPTVANLTAIGTAIKWYTAASGGMALPTTDGLGTGTYYASQTVGSCESVLRFAVAVTVNDPAAPTGTAAQSFCTIDNPTVANLTATGNGIQWYNAATGGTALVTTTALATQTYYASQTIGSCESALRFAVAVTVNDPAAPTGTAAQSFCTIDSPTVANLTATGSALKWYSAATGGSALVGTTALATQNVLCQPDNRLCESALRFAVAVTVNDPAAPTGTCNAKLLHN